MLDTPRLYTSNAYVDIPEVIGASLILCNDFYSCVMYTLLAFYSDFVHF